MIAERDDRDPNMMTLVAFSGDLDRIWPTTILATTGAAGGMDVAVFFTFWGLFSLVKEEKRLTGDNWMTKGLSLMNRGSAEHAGLSKLNMGGGGRDDDAQARQGARRGGARGADGDWPRIST